jgi:hypothetical protein
MREMVSVQVISGALSKKPVKTAIFFGSPSLRF